MKRMITRTINNNRYECLGIDLDTLEVKQSIVTLTGNPDNAKALSIIKSRMDNEHFTLVTARYIDTMEVLYGMSEDEFIAHAQPMPPRFSND